MTEAPEKINMLTMWGFVIFMRTILEFIDKGQDNKSGSLMNFLF